MSSIFSDELGAKLARWVFFTLLISIAPLVLDYIMVSMRSQAAVNYSEVLSKGQLFLLSSAFLCVSLGELAGTSKKFQIAKIVVSGLCALLIIFSIGLYAIANNQPSDAVFSLSKLSIVFYIASIVVSTSGLALAEARDDD